MFYDITAANHRNKSLQMNKQQRQQQQQKQQLARMQLL